jgi:TPR repeat protein
MVCVCVRCQSNSIEVAIALLDKSDEPLVNSVAYWRVAMRYWLGVGCIRDPSRARAYLYTSASLGHSQAKIELAKIYIDDHDDIAMGLDSHDIMDKYQLAPHPAVVNMSDVIKWYDTLLVPFIY